MTAKTTIGVMVLILLSVNIMNATEFYVDFENGLDSNDGLTKTTAWKHCPGDQNTTGIANTTTLIGGDIVFFKGGTRYLGELNIKHDGDVNNPIVFKGDGWGDEKAIFDGADELTSAWTQCVSAAECAGNNNFDNIYYTTAPENFDFFTGLYEDSQYLWFSQDPNPAERFNYDKIESFYEIPLGANFTTSELTDTGYFKQTDPNYWDGAYFLVWHRPNVTVPYPIKEFNPATNTIKYDTIGGTGIYNDRSSYFSILNHIGIIDQPGEYAFDTLTNRIYLWPASSDDPANHSFLLRKRNDAIRFNHRKNLIIEGFEIKNYTMGIRSQYADAENVIVRNNYISNLRSNDRYSIQVNGNNILVENNKIEDCLRSIGILAAGKNIRINNNHVKNTSRQGIWFMGVNHGSITNNVVQDIRGTHSNAISAYNYNENILIAGNKVYNTNNALTFHGFTSMPDLVMNLTIYNNYFENGVHGWGSYTKSVSLVNNVFKSGMYFDDEDTLTKSINNIFHKGGTADFNRNNLFTALEWSQSDKYGWSLDQGEIDWSNEDINEIYVDIENNDFRLLSTSVAINAGINPIAYLPVDSFPEYNFYQDILGNPRPKGEAWDIGVFEYQCSDSTNVRVSICEGDGYFVAGAEQTESGIYIDSLTNVMGCDSIITINLTVNPLSKKTNDVSICEGESFFAGGGNQTTAGTYYDTIINIVGCDSVIRTNLSVQACTGVNTELEEQLKVYPIPTHGILHVEGDNFSKMELYTLTGQLMLITEDKSIDLKGIKTGIYSLIIFDGLGNKIPKKVIYTKDF